MIRRVAERYAVDPGRVFVIGLSNGGFMAHRLACDHADQVAAVVSLAGAQFADKSACRPSRAVSVLQVHGTADDTVLFGGGSIAGHPYPSAAETVGRWRELDHCSAQATMDPPLDAVAAIAGRETTRTSWGAGCTDGSEVALWTVRGGPHVPEVTPSFTAAVVSWLEAHARRSG